MGIEGITPGTPRERYQKLREALDADKKLSEIQKNELLEFVQTVPPKVRNRFLASCLGQGGWTAERKAYCESCMGFEDAQTRVRECTQWATCPHWYNRPYQDKANTEDDT